MSDNCPYCKSEFFYCSKLEKIKEILSFCYSEEGTEIPCIDCKYYKECGIQPIDYVIKIIEGAEDDD